MARVTRLPPPPQEAPHVWQLELTHAEMLYLRKLTGDQKATDEHSSNHRIYTAVCEAAAGFSYA